MNEPDFQKAYAEQNRQDQITYSKLATVLSIILNLSCSVMDWWVYPEWAPFFFKLRFSSSLVVALAWVFFLTPLGRRYYRIFGIMWYASPLLCIQGMIFLADDPRSPYYAGLNIVLLAVGLLSPWTYVQNLISALAVIAMYVGCCYLMTTAQTEASVMNNTYFLVLTATIVVAGSVANSRQRRREFELRWELNRSRKAVEESNQKLVELDQVKSRFFANISHELRTPLTLLIAPLETIMRRYSRQFDAETVGLLQTMHGNGLRLLKLINDLLDLVRLDSGVMQAKREPIPFDHFIRGLASAARQVAQDKDIQLDVLIAPDIGVVMLDRDKLEKIVLNLQFNALKFTPRGGRVRLSAERVDDKLILKVSDTGIGIPAKNLPNVFERFFQVDSSSRRKFQGVGIGLALVKELVEIHEGTVSVESTEGQGTTFTVQFPYLEAPPDAIASPVPEILALPGEPLPEPSATDPAGGAHSGEEWLSNLYHRANLFVSPAAAEESAPLPEPAANGHAQSVLIADDEPDMLRFLKSQLAPHYTVIEAANGQQAVDRAIARPPDLILLDMMMPEKDGMQACRELRANASTQNVPIVLLTARADEDTKIAALSAGASDFLPKPFSTTELHVRIRNLVQSYDFQRTLSRQKNELQETIDQLKETETLLVHTEKLASLGRMSAGLIHEINNPLNFATTGLYTLRNKARFLASEQQADYAEVLHDVEEGIGRVKTIVSDLRSFTHPDTASLDEVSVPESVTAALRFLSHGQRDRTRIDVEVPEGLHVWANRNSFTQVVLNLLQNSLDALQKKQFEGETPVVTIAGRQENGRSLLVVRDNGTGIPPEIIDKIFDPFFTTKEVGEGMGLGLSICYRIVEASGGKISVRSEPGKLCEFTLDFPESSPKQY